jgi:hypothetical protein
MKHLKKTLLISAYVWMLPLTTLAAAKLQNPLGTTSPQVVIGNIIRSLLGLSGALALLMFIYGGMLWIISGGSAEKIKKGKDTLVWATFGLAIIFMSYTLVEFVIDALAG